ncbi:MAG: DUF4417 domain-containing protein [Erysipelotrichaceae bacterium]|nr:DUF4417 domain-containing protein [Erysipelotrichaceae bacterium]
MKKNTVYKTAPVNHAGLTDIWNAFMVKKATFSNHDIPLCPTTATKIPEKLIGYDEAKTIHKKMILDNKPNYHINAFIHFYIDDSKFDGKKTSFWLYPNKVFEIACHFDGIIAPDPSTYADFPDPLKRWNYYRMNAFGFWIASQGIEVISNVRWDTPDTWEYCFDGNPCNSMLAIGTVASSLKYKLNYALFADGLRRMYELLTPHTLIIYGSANYPCFDELRNNGVTVIVFPSKTSEYYKRRKTNE